MKKDGFLLNYVPQHVQTENICYQAVIQNFFAFQYVDRIFASSSLICNAALEGVARNGLYIKFLPLVFQSYEVCMQAVLQNSEAICFISNEQVLKKDNYKICFEAVKRNSKSLKSILLRYSHILSPNLKDSLCRTAIDYTITILNQIDFKLPKKYYYKAFKQDPLSFIDFCTMYNSKKLTRLALENSPSTFDSLIKNLQFKYITVKNCKMLLKKDPSKFRLMTNFQTMKLCYQAVDLEPDNIIFVKDEYKTPDICLLAVKKNGLLLSFLRNYQSYELCLAAVNQNPAAFQFVNQEYKNENLCMLAVTLDGYNLKFIDNQTHAICHAAVYNKTGAIEFVKKKFQSQELCLYVVKKDGYLLNHVYKKTKIIVEAAQNFDNHF